MGSQRKHFIQFDVKPTVIQGAIKLDNQPIISATNSCMLALFDDNSANIHYWCRSIFISRKGDPHYHQTNRVINGASQHTNLSVDVF